MQNIPINAIQRGKFLLNLQEKKEKKPLKNGMIINKESNIACIFLLFTTTILINEMMFLNLEKDKLNYIKTILHSTNKSK